MEDDGYERDRGQPRGLLDVDDSGYAPDRGQPRRLLDIDESSPSLSRHTLLDKVPHDLLRRKEKPNSEEEREQFGQIAASLVHSKSRSDDLRESANSIANSAGSPDREFEGSYGEEADARAEMYDLDDPYSVTVTPDDTPPQEETSSGPVETLRKTGEFLFSDEIAMLGFKWDGEAYEWGKENTIEQFVDHPYMSALTLASYVVPLGFAARAGARMSKRGKDIAELGIKRREGLTGSLDTLNPEQMAEAAGAASGRGFLGTTIGFKFDDHAKMVKTLADPSVNLDGLPKEGSDIVTQFGRGFFSDNYAKKISEATSAAEIRKLVPEARLKKMLQADYQQEQWVKLKKRNTRPIADNDPLGPLTRREKISYAAQKNFQNTYFESLQDMQKSHIMNMNDFYVKAGLGKVLADAPGYLNDAANDEVYKFFLAGPGRNVEELAGKIGQKEADWAQEMATRWTDLFDLQVKEGMVSAETAVMFREGVGSGLHLPAIRKGTPGFGDVGGKTKNLQRGDNVLKKPRFEDGPENMAAQLGGPTTKKRGKYTSRQLVLDGIEKGELETGAVAMTQGGFIKDSMLFQVYRNFRDTVLAEGENVLSKVDYDMLTTKGGREKYINVDDLDDVVPGLAEKITNMVNVKRKEDGLEAIGEMPYVDKDVVESFFGSNGSARQASGSFARFFELMTAVHKTAKTSLNPATHMSNVLGNMNFLLMRGMNAFGKASLDDGGNMADAFSKLAKQVQARKKSAKAAGHEAPDITLSELMSKDNLAEVMGENRYITDDIGERIDLAEMFSDPSMQQMIEAQSFDAVEGLASVKSTITNIQNANATGWGDKALLKVANGIAGLTDSNAAQATLEKASAAYLAEDMVPKMMYAMNLARQGLGRDAILREVGRALPQYNTVGKLPKDSRKLVLPWITWTAEAARITKNNMMDRPISTSMWMQGPQIAQSVISGVGAGPDTQVNPGTGTSELQDAQANAPRWANKGSTVMVGGESANSVIQSAGGMAAGTLAGTVRGGARGGAIGAAIGAVGGAALGALGGGDDTPRAWNLDWMVTQTLDIGTHSQDVLRKLDPFNETPWSGAETFGAALDVSPVAPLAVAMPIINTALGRDSFGEEMDTSDGVSGMASNMSKAFIGFLSPPMLQKYAMKMGGADGNPVEMAEIFEKNGGQATLPKLLTATVAGLAVGGLTFMGTRNLDTSRKLASGVAAAAYQTAKAARRVKPGSLLAKTPKTFPVLAGVGKGDKIAAAGMGTVAALAGSEVNVRKLSEDLGLSRNPHSMQPGDPGLDFFTNNFLGMKSWKAGNSNNALPRREHKMAYTHARTKVNKNITAYVSDNNISGIKGEVRKMYQLFKQQYIDDPSVALEKFNAWKERIYKTMAKNPAYSTYSNDELERELLKMRAKTKAAVGEANKVMQKALDEMKTESLMRGLRNAKGLTIVDGQPPNG